MAIFIKIRILLVLSILGIWVATGLAMYGFLRFYPPQDMNPFPDPWIKAESTRWVRPNIGNPEVVISGNPSDNAKTGSGLYFMEKNINHSREDLLRADLRTGDTVIVAELESGETVYKMLNASSGKYIAVWAYIKTGKMSKEQRFPETANRLRLYDTTTGKWVKITNNEQVNEWVTIEEAHVGEYYIPDDYTIFDERYVISKVENRQIYLLGYYLVFDTYTDKYYTFELPSRFYGMPHFEGMDLDNSTVTFWILGEYDTPYKNLKSFAKDDQYSSSWEAESTYMRLVNWNVEDKSYKLYPRFEISGGIHYFEQLSSSQFILGIQDSVYIFNANAEQPFKKYAMDMVKGYGDHYFLYEKWDIVVSEVVDRPVFADMREPIKNISWYNFNNGSNDTLYSIDRLQDENYWQSILLASPESGTLSIKLPIQPDPAYQDIQFYNVADKSKQGILRIPGEIGPACLVLNEGEPYPRAGQVIVAKEPVDEASAD